MSDVVELVLDEIGDVATALASVLPAGARVVFQVVGVVAHGASGVVRSVDALELEQIKHAAALGEAAGRAAYDASKQVRGPTAVPVCDGCRAELEKFSSGTAREIAAGETCFYCGAAPF